ncbi:hypothetical protein JCM10908_001649 [Rhodotorula pacifica]|uniref:uncharacterized protein n=1 Tax=Rhodotorula pacifica TaxID=1495444 RepID=UPI003178DF6E
MRSLHSLAWVVLAPFALAAPTSSPAASAVKASDPPAFFGAISSDGYTSQKWIDALEKARATVASLTFEQKINFTDLRTGSTNGCSGLTFPLPQAGIKNGLCEADGPTGINSRYSTQFPAEVSVAATWDRDIFYARASAESAEYARLGAQVPLSIVVGPMGRSVYGGRNWEGFSPDPFLSGEAVRYTVQAFQENKVTALVKHFVGNEQERFRYGSEFGLAGVYYDLANQTVDSLIDAATLRETYTYAFAEAIRAGASSMMCAYQLYNGEFSCQSEELLLDHLKTELNFHGWVITDWDAGHNTTSLALNGTDAIGGLPNLFGNALAEVIRNNTVPEAMLDDKLIRILTPWYALDQVELPDVDFERYVANQTSKDVTRKTLESAITLLKNSNATDKGLPINKPHDIALIGSPAAPSRFGILNNLPFTFNVPWTPYQGVISDGFGSGSSPAAYVVDPLTGFIVRGLQEERPINIDGYYSDDPWEGTFHAEMANVSAIDTKLMYASKAFVFVAAAASESWDRKNLELLNNGGDLIKYVADHHNDTIVYVEAPGPVDMQPWASHPNVTAIMYGYFGGQEMGHAIANVAFGDVNPSGKLPFTIAKQVSDYPLNLYNGSAAIHPVANFSEGNFIDYKYFDAKGIQPLYEFGYGLSYSTFAVSDVSAWPKTGPCPAFVRETNEKLFIDGQLSEMGLYDYAATVQVTVTNTGKVDGAEVAQLYLTYPDGIPRKMADKSLRGFIKPYLKAGESQTVQFELRNKDLAYWCAEYHGWVVPRGDFTFHVGTSSRNLPFQKTFTF